MFGIELWVPVTIAAAFLQNIRSSLQKHLKGRVGTAGATFVRFGYGLPFAALLVAVLHLGWGRPLPGLTGSFAVWIVLAALSQIAAQVCLIAAFAHHNFAVATAYSRTEPVHAAAFGLILIGDRMGLSDVVAVLLTFVGVALISLKGLTLAPGRLWSALTARGALLGLASGLIFGFVAVAYRAASRALEADDAFMQGAMTLLVAIAIQSVLLLCWMWLRNRRELLELGRLWKTGILVGFVGAAASWGWFSALTLQGAALVKALAQVEMVFTFLTGWLIFRERLTMPEVCGCLAIVAGILILLLA